LHLLLWSGAKPRPLNERQSLEQERTELAEQLATHRREVENGSPHRARRERLGWQIRKAEKRLAEIEARLAKSELRERHQEDHEMTATHP